MGLKLKEQNAERVNNYEYLGIRFDDKLFWKYHLDAVV